MAYEVKKDPAADLDYGFDWTAWLGIADTITLSTWTVPTESGLTTHSPSISPEGKVTAVWLKAGCFACFGCRVRSARAAKMCSKTASCTSGLLLVVCEMPGSITLL